MSTQPQDALLSEFSKGRSRLNRTVAALMGRGFDCELAEHLYGRGYTLGRLQQMNDRELSGLRVPDHVIKELRKGRPPVPFSTLAAVLFANRFTCCVCRNPKFSVILHHIDGWHASHSHEPENLAVLCLEHHNKAHTTSELSANLSTDLLRDHKLRWEQKASQFDARAILDATAAISDIWWYFNHQRLFQLAVDLGIEFKRLSNFRGALLRGLVDQNGALLPLNTTEHWMYSGGNGIPLGYYVSDVLRAVLKKIPLLNISDDLDRGLLEGVIKPGDFIFVQGSMNFKESAKTTKRGPGQVTTGRRTVNSVEIRFTIDRWEATSNSAWSDFLVGRREACALVRVLTVTKGSNRVLIESTSLVIGPALQGLKHREYANAPFRRGYLRISDSHEDDFADDFRDPENDGSDDPANYDIAPRLEEL